MGQEHFASALFVLEDGQVVFIASLLSLQNSEYCKSKQSALIFVNNEGHSFKVLRKLVLDFGSSWDSPTHSLAHTGSARQRQSCRRPPALANVLCRLALIRPQMIKKNRAPQNS